MSGIAALAPFRTRNFRFQWPADLLTAWALEMETLILGWYVLVQTGSVMWLTVFGSMQYVGTLISPLIGTLGDRLGLRNVLAGMRFAYTTCASALLALAVTGRLEPMLLLAIAACSGLLRPSDIGMRNALVGATMPPGQLVAAMGISRTTQDSARIAGALAGAGFIASFGIPAAYMVITAIYLSGALLTLLVADPSRARQASLGPGLAAQRQSPWSDVKEALLYVWRTPRLLAAMSLATLVNLTAFPLTGGLMPYIARDVFHMGQQGLGLLVASFATGCFLGSVSLSIIGPRIRAGRTMMWTSVIWYLCLFGFVMAGDVKVAMSFLLVAGIAQSFSMVSLAIMLLRTSEERFRGRIMGVRMLAIYTLPLGLLIAGAAIPRFGYQATAMVLVIAGLLLTFAIAILWREDLVRPTALANAR
ncbi:MAG: MFS transporter [Proteobacteria bacterium]|nr:MFS transporter [Pseudomonadota bacterium]